jgi:hypothetical protein
LAIGILGGELLGAVDGVTYRMLSALSCMTSLRRLTYLGPGLEIAAGIDRNAGEEEEG